MTALIQMTVQGDSLWQKDFPNWHAEIWAISLEKWRVADDKKR